MPFGRNTCHCLPLFLSFPGGGGGWAGAGGRWGGGEWNSGTACTCLPLSEMGEAGVGGSLVEPSQGGLLEMGWIRMDTCHPSAWRLLLLPACHHATWGMPAWVGILHFPCHSTFVFWGCTLETPFPTPTISFIGWGWVTCILPPLGLHTQVMHFSLILPLVMFFLTMVFGLEGLCSFYFTFVSFPSFLPSGRDRMPASSGVLHSLSLHCHNF